MYPSPPPSLRRDNLYSRNQVDQTSSLASSYYEYRQVYALGDDDDPAATEAISIAESLSEGALYIAGTFSEEHMSVPLIPDAEARPSTTVLSAYGRGQSKDLTQAFVVKLPRPKMEKHDLTGFTWAKQSLVSPDPSTSPGIAVASTILPLKDGTGAVLMGIAKGHVEWRESGSKDNLKLNAPTNRTSIYVIRLDTSGSALWGVTIPMSESEDVAGLPSGGIDEGGTIFLVGSFRGKVKVGDNFVIDSGSATSASFAARINPETGTILSVSRLTLPNASSNDNMVIGAIASGTDCGAGWIMTGCAAYSDTGKECFVGNLNGESKETWKPIEELSVLARWKVGSGLELDVLGKVGTLNAVHRSEGHCTYVATGLRITDSESSNTPLYYVKTFESSQGTKLWSRDVTNPNSILKRSLAVGLAPSNDGKILVSGAGQLSKELVGELKVPSAPLSSGFLITMNLEDGKASSYRYLHRVFEPTQRDAGVPLALHAISNSSGMVLVGAMRGPIPSFDGKDAAPIGGGAGGGMSAWIAVLEKMERIEQGPGNQTTSLPTGIPEQVPGQGETVENPWTSVYLVFLLAALLLVPIALCARKSLKPILGRRSFPLREFGSGNPFSSTDGPNSHDERQLLNDFARGNSEDRYLDDESDDNNGAEDRRREGNQEVDRMRREEERGKGKGKGKGKATVGEHFRIESEDEEFF